MVRGVVVLVFFISRKVYIYNFSENEHSVGVVDVVSLILPGCPVLFAPSPEVFALSLVVVAPSVTRERPRQRRSAGLAILQEQVG